MNAPVTRRIRIARKMDVPEGTGVAVSAEGLELALFRVDGDYHVIDNWCPHQGGSLVEGPLEGTVVTCPWHGWAFDVTTGRMPGHHRIRVQTYSVVVEGDDILVELPSAT